MTSAPRPVTERRQRGSRSPSFRPMATMPMSAMPLGPSTGCEGNYPEGRPPCRLQDEKAWHGEHSTVVCRIEAWSARLLSRSPEHDPEGAEDEVQVEAEAPVVHVLQIEPHPVVERDLVTTGADLPVAGEARTDREAAVLPGLVARHLAGQRRTRPDDAHVPDQDVDQLGQL